MLAETDQCTENMSTYSEDLNLFCKLFKELVAESTDDDDPKIAEAMKWLKRASILRFRVKYETV